MKNLTGITRLCTMVMLLVCLTEATGLMALYIIGLKDRVYPWTFLLLLRYSFYREVFLSALLFSIPVVAIAGWMQKGMVRYFSVVVSGLLLLLFASFGTGLFILGLAKPETGLSLATLPAFLHALSSDATLYQHFLYTQLASGLIFSVFAGHFIFERLRPANRVLGNAHFASAPEIKKAGFLDREEESLVIGKKLGVPLYANGFEHVLVFAPAGSGKTRSIAIPNLFNYPWSVVCNDVKLTLFETTSGYRKNVLGHECYCFAPARHDSRTHRYNPLSLISENKLARMTDIQRIAHIIIPGNSKEAAIWTQGPRKLFKILVLYLLDTPDKPTTLGEMNRLIKQQDFDGWLSDILNNTTHYDAEFYRNGFSYINVHEETRSNIFETFSGYFELFDDPVIDAATSHSDFDLRDLRKRKITIYIGFTDEDMERLSPILTLFWQQLISVMIENIPDPKIEPWPLLCLIDEFSSLGRIERLRRSLKLLREYRVRCILMFQYIAQTYEKYSHDEARAFTNIKTKIAYGSEDTSDAEFISKMLGTRTKKVVTRSVSTQSGNINDSKNVSYQAIPLLRPEDVMKLPLDRALIIRTGTSPVKAKQYIWYQESDMKHLRQTPVYIPQQTPIQQAFEHRKKVEKTKDVKKKVVHDDALAELDWIDS